MASFNSYISFLQCRVITLQPAMFKHA